MRWIQNFSRLFGGYVKVQALPQTRIRSLFHFIYLACHYEKDILDKQYDDTDGCGCSCGGNLLMNVGPTSQGTIEPIFQLRLKLVHHQYS